MPAASDNKLYLTYNSIHRTVKELADKIISSNYDPDTIVAIGTGGFIPARILKTYLNRPILTVGIVYYGAHNKPMDSPKKVQWIDEVERKLTGKKVLLVDEVDDSRTTLEYCLTELLSHNPTEIAVAVLHNKQKDKRGFIPKEVRHYFFGKIMADSWIVYPWDAEDIDDHEEKANR